MRSIPVPLSSLGAYAQAAGLGLLACALQWSVHPWVGSRIPFLFLLPSVVMGAAWKGRGPGLLVLAIGLVNGLLWMPPVGSLEVADPVDRVSLLLYVVLGLLLVWVGAQVRVKTARAAAAEEQLVLTVENTGMGLFNLDLAAGTGFASPSLARLAGLPAMNKPVPLTDWLARLPAEAVSESRAVLAQKLRERATSYEREVRIEREPGQAVWLMLRVHIVWEGARAVRLRGACVDITERKRVEAQLAQTRGELRQQVEDLQALHELSSRLLDTDSLDAQLHMTLQTLVEVHGTRRGMLSLVDADGLRLRLVASMGLSPAARTQLADVPVGEGACGLACAARHRVVIEDTEKDARFEAYRVLAKQEGFRAVHSTPLITQQGDVLGAISVHLDTPRGPSERERALADICARKATVFIERARAQAALEEAQGRYRAVLEASAVPFSVLAPVRNEHGAVIDFSWSYLNTAAAQALQGEPGSFVGRRLMQILPPSWRHSEAFANCMAVADGAQTRRFEIHTTHRGADRWFHCIAWPMRGSVAVWFADISERKKTEQLLHEADRRKDEFLATLAHELRNPLAPIRQAALLSKAPNATEAQKRWSHEVIDRQVQHMALLLDDLLDVSRITRGVLSLRKSSAELAAVIDAAIETARPLIDAKRHKLSVDLPSTTVRFEADPLRISQVVANLLANAAKYTDPGGHIRVRAAREDDEIVIDVIDDGIGIPPASLGEVFQMFVQLHHTGDRTGGGLGIGLALTRGLVELHGGRIEAVSDGPGTGSRFTVHLPVGATAGSDVAAPTLPLAAPPVWRKILVADDNRDAADSLALLLELQGHQVVRALDGESALESYRRLQPDICLLDIGMPGRSGYEVARAIRQSPGGDRPVLIAITGWGQEHDRSQAIAAGFDHHMTKPVDPQRLTRLVVADVPYRPQRTAVDETGTAG